MTKSFQAEPFALSFDPETTALVVIDMQRDFVEPGGFGEALGNDVSLVRTAIEPCAKLLKTARDIGLMVIHTREGHRPDLSDCPPAKLNRGGKAFIGETGPKGRILIRGEAGHDTIPELYPVAGEPVIDKPGKGAFYQTDLELILQNRNIKTLIVCGVTTEVCVNTTVREANDRGYECIIPEDCVASYFPEFQKSTLEMIKAQGGIFGWVSDSDKILAALK
ncbi:nicotinamidase-related amidase [Psychrobacter sp. PL15]|jgi:nicotinamidase-related amidase|uniref:cysteine hydrolase family protein n=1 Tax=unclassified Psychrobacter TaxID=196806 RepID=UPI001AE14578|nr:isochorismatase family cysteine hydrolase [Psychrobacter sp. PL15]MEC5210893.1 nicotinamidase-related amidase [Psychrobacter sp. PL15]